MSESGDANVLATAIALAAGYREPVARARFLTGGVSARIVAFDLEGIAGRLVARIHGDRDFTSNPRIANLEFDLLAHLYAHGVRVAQPIAVIDAGVVGPRPVLVTSWIDGNPDQRPGDVRIMAAVMARALVAVHRVPLPATLRDRLPVARLHPGRWSDRWRELGVSEPAMRGLERHTGDVRGTGHVLLHGDYWPGNILWREDGSIAGIVDWEDACFGDRRFDVAGGFLELVLATSLEAGRTFVATYASEHPASLVDLGIFVLDAALRLEPKIPEFGLLPDAEAAMRTRLGEVIAICQGDGPRHACPLAGRERQGTSR